MSRRTRWAWEPSPWKDDTPVCRETWDVPWKGHTAVLYHAKCHRRTHHPSGYCWQHRPPEWLQEIP